MMGDGEGLREREHTLERTRSAGESSVRTPRNRNLKHTWNFLSEVHFLTELAENMNMKLDSFHRYLNDQFYYTVIIHK